jgi:hypothetical protein
VVISDVAVIKCNYELCSKVVNKSNLQSKTPSIATYTRDIIIITKIFFFEDLVILFYYVEAQQPR